MVVPHLNFNCHVRKLSGAKWNVTLGYQVGNNKHMALGATERTESND